MSAERCARCGRDLATYGMGDRHAIGGAVCPACWKGAKPESAQYAEDYQKAATPGQKRAKARLRLGKGAIE